MFDWRFNPLLLNDINFRQHVDNLITDYLSHNDTSDVTDSTLWEAFKAVMRGHIIAYEAKLKKKPDKRKCLKLQPSYLLLKKTINSLLHLPN